MEGFKRLFRGLFAHNTERNGIIPSDSQTDAATHLKDFDMANVNQTLATLMQLDGAIGACIVDSNSGMVLGKAGGGSIDMEIAAAGNTEVVRAKLKTMEALGLHDSIEDMLITLGSQYHILRPSVKQRGMFVYVALDKAKSNLAMARLKVANAEQELAI